MPTLRFLLSHGMTSRTPSPMQKMKPLFKVLVILIVIGACKKQECTDMYCITPFEEGRIRVVDFALKNGDSIVAVKYEENGFTQPLDTFVGRVEINVQNGYHANDVQVNITPMGEGDNWKIIVPGGQQFKITDISASPAPCNKCTVGKTYYNLYEFKVNGEAQNTIAILKK